MRQSKSERQHANVTNERRRPAGRDQVFPPRLNTRHIPRTHLLERLQEGRLGCVTLITGGAGFGKTLLLAQWRQALLKDGLDVAWLSLSHDDRLFPSFLTYLLAALRRLDIAIEAELLHGDSGEAAFNALVAQVTRIAEQLGRELYLLIDDYQHVEAPLAHRLMQKLLDHCPPNLHLVIASRSSPPLSLGRLRMQGQVAEIDFAELPFDLEETRVFFEHNLGSLKLTADEEQLIHELTSGWPASLQPIATLLRNRPAKRPKLRSLLWKSADLQAYLAEDVVACLAPELLGLMEQVSPFRRFNADLAAFVTGNPHAADLIKRVEDENLLIYRVDSDDQTPWYRFHPLFGEFLGQRLAQQGSAAVEALHRRASQWFAEHELLVESVRHANLGGDLDFAVAAMEQAASATWSMAYISPMLHLLERLPQETLFAHPRLFILGCLTYAFTARPEKAARWLEQIRRTEAARNPALSSRFALADAAIALQLDNPRRVIGLLEPMHQAPLENRSLRYISLSALASAYLALGASTPRVVCTTKIPSIRATATTTWRWSSRTPRPRPGCVSAMPARLRAWGPAYWRGQKKTTGAVRSRRTCARRTCATPTTSSIASTRPWPCWPTAAASCSRRCPM
ncbi:AAA family ATPase [Pseudomonas denitrificans (nom. rej.)]|uniref:AAA family ATPase n=1 Tax=Pseudomonas denitrificans TaxID=43306 RepID=UPI001E579476|nr:AAA family ATPase [Pseudomonas denitrificans (nom. rej.)]